MAPPVTSSSIFPCFASVFVAAAARDAGAALASCSHGLFESPTALRVFFAINSLGFPPPWSHGRRGRPRKHNANGWPRLGRHPTFCVPLLSRAVRRPSPGGGAPPPAPPPSCD
eukprot:TRINITY_DN870_c0_g1_i2.p2 TRINITY_DN870_c0_g1~~TRINITY_DN870_c0_g1_i2.p2  ORF type:complete len:113 (-),score=14.17 TRINITY_DN870_c0_g1_i2:1-339(-)